MIFFPLRKGHDNKCRPPKERSKRSGHRESESRLDEETCSLTSSHWDLLPVEIQVKIFAKCSVLDLLPLRLVCRAFYEILTAHEHSIAREYLRRRRHGTLPSTISNERTYTRNPEDDVVLLSDLFPPGKSVKGGHLYTFRYLHSLRRRQQLCGRLCHYLADRVMDRFMHTEQEFIKWRFDSKMERNLFNDRGVASLRYNIIPLMYCILYFLESYASARKEHLNGLLRDYEAGRIPVPLPLQLRSTMYAELQTRILQSPPFTDTSTLIATHHCIRLLVSYIRHTMPSDEWGLSDDSWIGALLTVSGFGRVVEFFSAEIGDGGNQRAQRKDFMHNFQHDMKIFERDELKPMIYQRPPDGNPSYLTTREVWFHVASRELQARNAIPHDAEKVSAWNGILVLVGCEHCRSEFGWQA